MRTIARACFVFVSNLPKSHNKINPHTLLRKSVSQSGKNQMKEGERKETTRQMSSEIVEFSNASNGFVSLIEIDCCSI